MIKKVIGVFRLTLVRPYAYPDLVKFVRLLSFVRIIVIMFNSSNSAEHKEFMKWKQTPVYRNSSPVPVQQIIMLQFLDIWC